MCIRDRGKNTRYTLVDAGLSAFSVFFMQSPSFLEYQRSLDQRLGKNNAQTLFGVHQIPSDNRIRHLLDATDPGQVRPLFSYLLQALHRAGVVESYRSVNQTLLPVSYTHLPLVEQGRFIAPGIGRGELEQQFEIALDIFRLQLRQRRAVVQ